MKKILLITLLYFFEVYNAYATPTVSVDISGGKVSAMIEKDEVSLYNFSDNLLNAVQNCSPYQENFTDTNPKLKSLGQMFGGVTFEVWVDIKGFDNEMCNFVITQKFSGIGGNENVCSVDKEVLSQIISAMKNRSTELITETFTTKSTVTDGDGNVIDTSEVNNTVTGSAFDIMLTKVMGNNCQVKEIAPTQEEQHTAQKQMLGFSDNFITSLKTCTPNKEEKRMFFSTMNAEIVGKKDNLCHIRTSEFDFYIAQDKVSDIKDFKVLYALATDGNVAKYRALQQYSLSSILSTLKNCSQKQYTSNGSSVSEKMDKIKIEKSISTEYENNQCTLMLTNKLTLDGDVRDYSIKCNVSDENIKIITSKVAVSKDNKENRKIGKQILRLLIKNKLCSKMQ